MARTGYGGAYGGDSGTGRQPCRRADVAPARGSSGRLVALDPLTGALLATATLPGSAAVADLVLASAPAGSARPGETALYASVQIPGPMRDEALTLSAERRFEVVSLDPEFLDVTATWPIDRAAGTFAVTPNGARAYLLGGSGVSGSPSRNGAAAAMIAAFVL